MTSASLYKQKPELSSEDTSSHPVQVWPAAWPGNVAGIRGTQSWFVGLGPESVTWVLLAVWSLALCLPPPQLGQQAWDPTGRSFCFELGVRVPCSSHFWSVEGEASLYAGWGSRSRLMCLALSVSRGSCWRPRLCCWW